MSGVRQAVSHPPDPNGVPHARLYLTNRPAAYGTSTHPESETEAEELGTAKRAEDCLQYRWPYADPEKAARKILEIANSVEAVQDGRIHIEKINAPFLYNERGSPAEYGAGLKFAIERGWLVLHESGTFVRFTQAGAELFA